MLLGLSPAGAPAQAVSEQAGTTTSVKTGRLWITALEKGSPVADLKKEDLRL